MNKRNILLVEDNAIIAMSEKMELERCGYNTHFVTTGEKAVSIITHVDLPIDLVLMDLDLGSGIDGIQATKQILNYKDIPIIFMSSHTEPEVVEKIEKITSYGFLEKTAGIIVINTVIKVALKLFEEKILLKRNKSYC